MRKIYKPLVLGITLAMAVGSNAAHAKQSLVKNVVKSASPKQHAGAGDDDKPSKHSVAKAHNTKLVQVSITKNITKQIAVKAHKTPEVIAKAERSVIKQVLSKHQEQQQRHKPISPVRHQAAAEPAKSVALLETTLPKFRRKTNEKEAVVVADEAPIITANKTTEPFSSGDVVFNASDNADTSSSHSIFKTQSGRQSVTYYKVKRGDTLASIAQDRNLNVYGLHQGVHNRKLSRQFRHLIPGKTLSITTNGRGELAGLSYKNDSMTDLMQTADNTAEQITGNESIYASTESTESTMPRAAGQVKHVSTHVIIHDDSLEQTASQAGLPKKITKQLTDIFAWDIDFSQNLRPNDQFTLVYEKIFDNGRAVDTGDIVAAEFTNQGEKHQAVRYRDNTGVINYYTPEGEGMHRAFLRNPLEFAKVSSFFNPARRHPVLNRIRAHKGVDYAASTGTPIKSTGDGSVAFKGVKGGYGRVVTIDHGNEYSTLYAHLSNFSSNVDEGSQVKQGQVIGYVGASGLATGPHLHYEFLVNGVHKDPLTVKLPHSMPIDKSLIAYFKTQTRPLLAQLERAKSTVLAKNTTEE